VTLVAGEAAAENNRFDHILTTSFGRSTEYGKVEAGKRPGS
jgi:hypothetical protein